MDTLRAAKKARALLARRWVQNMEQVTFEEADGPVEGYCLVGAIKEASAHDERTMNRLGAAVLGAIRIRGGRTDDPSLPPEDIWDSVIPDWNDYEKRRRYHVLRAMNRVIARLEAERALKRIKRATAHVAAAAAADQWKWVQRLAGADEIPTKI